MRNNLNVNYKTFIQSNSINRFVCLLTGAFTFYIGYRFLTIHNFNDTKEVSEVLALMIMGFPFGILFKKLFFQLSHERIVKKLRCMNYEELLSEKGWKYRLLDREAFEHVIKDF